MEWSYKFVIFSVRLPITRWFAEEKGRYRPTMMRRFVKITSIYMYTHILNSIDVYIYIYICFLCLYMCVCNHVIAVSRRKKLKNYIVLQKEKEKIIKECSLSFFFCLLFFLKKKYFCFQVTPQCIMCEVSYLCCMK